MFLIKKIKSKIKSFSYWLNGIASFRKFVIEYMDYKTPLVTPSEPMRIAVIVQPWLMTPTPFFSIATGLFLVKRGNRVDYIIDDLFFGKSLTLYRIQILSIKYIVKLLPRSVKIIFISELDPLTENKIITNVNLMNLSYQNTVHFMKGELKNDGRKEYQDNVYNQLYKARPFINSFFLNASYDSIHLSGGIYSTTGLYLAYAKHYHIRANTFDAGFGVLVSSTNGIAAQLSDIPYGVSLLEKEIDHSEREFIRKFSLEQIEQRKAGTDVFGFLDSGINPELIPEKVGVLILLNSVWDSAALGIQNIYEGYVEWLDSTIEYILTHTDQNVTVRQHPGEKLDYQAPSDDLQSHLDKKFNYDSRILFVDCNSKINTYQLIEASDIVVCYSSTSGIESAILGKTVIVASNCYYSNQNFVFKPNSLNNYYNLIEDGIAGKLNVQGQGIDKAILFYFLGQCCNWIFTEFTPMPADFQKWVNEKDLSEVSEVQLYLKSIEEYLPISLLVGRTKISKFKLS